MILKRTLYILILIGLLITGCKRDVRENPVDYVNPFIGTGGHGHTYPGATVPFGMVQLSPDTRKDSWDGCSGYHYSDSVIFGFSHTHLSGTGVGDYGDIRFMPIVGELKTEPGYDDPASGYGSFFQHERETAKAGYYATHLNDYNIYVGLTATEHAGFHKYLFPESDNAHIILDLKESVTTENIIESSIQIISNTEISGLRRTGGWASDQYVYFYAQFSKPFYSFGFVEDGIKVSTKAESSSKNLKAWFDFKTDSHEIILLKVGISAVDVEGARNNLITEIPEWDFKQVRKDARNKWVNQLHKIEVTEGNEKSKEIFYTALYHAMLAPNLYSDVDGRYRGHNLQVKQSNEFTNYTVFSLWDTFRTLHPLFTIIQRQKTNDFIQSMLDMYHDDGLLPVWELAACETNCMIGYHSVPVIVDAYKKGIIGFDANTALIAMQETSGSNLFGLEWYRKKGYIPADKEGSSVSRTLEYAYDDWCIAEFAQMLGQDEVYKEYTRRAQYYKNIYDPETGFFRGKSNGSFAEPFDPTEVNFMLTEANTWQYNFFVPQDINSHIELLGGERKYEAKLDELFNSEAGLAGRHQSDITGLIGQYAHGNEPSHHMAYLYNYVGKAWKTQELVHQIMGEMYGIEPDGLSGNEDCGQMSAWYVMSAMGLYPVTPGTDVYVLGTPAFSSLNLNLENGNVFQVVANNLNEDNYYVQSVYYNDELWVKSYITHDMIMSGGKLVFNMDEKPNKEFGKGVSHRPVQQITTYLISPVPYFKAPSKTFEEPMNVEIRSIEKEAEIIWGYQTEEDEPLLEIYNKPLKIDRNRKVIARSTKDARHSFFEQAEYVNIPAGRSVAITYPYNPQYTAGGDKALINTLRGGENFTTGNWQGFWGDDLIATIDLGEAQVVRRIGVGFLQDQNSWIFMPERVKFEVSQDGIRFKEVGVLQNDIDEREDGGIVEDFEVAFDKQEIKFIRVTAENKGKCPAWHKGYPDPCWIFVDEVWWK